MKTCTICRIKKPLDKFYKTKAGTPLSQCKDCRNKQIYARKKRKKDWFASLKEFPCEDCRREYPSYVMQWDHRDPALKDSEVSSMLKYNRSVDKILEEIAKCDLVCANCHMIRTHGNR